jgi:hypothetical protein
MPTSTQSHHEESWDQLLEWLSDSGLTAKAAVFEAEATNAGFERAQSVVLGVPTHRAETRSSAERQQIRERAVAHNPTADKGRWSAIWSELKNPKDAVRHLDIARIPAEAIAFYRPFHFEPVDQWGIYVVLPKLVSYCHHLERSLGRLKSFDRAALMSLVLFDVFHHEFFHHLVECMATTVEVLWPAAAGGPAPLYLLYRRRSWHATLGGHADDPLEEALANAYAYNSFSFMARVQGGYLSGISRIYQKGLERSWPKEPPGYRAAEAYIRGGRFLGAEMLLDRILCTVARRQILPTGMLVDAVFPSGHTAYWAKPDIPTYLIGSDDELNAFLTLVPAPNETYSYMFWPFDTKPLDEYIRAERQREREAKRLLRQVRLFP